MSISLKYAKAFFQLVYVLDGVTKTASIDEPIDWNKVPIILERDDSLWGMNYEYTDSDIQLKFDEVAGADIIDSVYSVDGNDGSVILQYGHTVSGSKVVDYSGKLDLNTYKKQDGIISCTLTNSGIQELINSRENTDLDLYATETVDGDACEVVSDVEVELHSKGIKKRYISVMKPATTLVNGNNYTVYKGSIVYNGKTIDPSTMFFQCTTDDGSFTGNGVVYNYEKRTRTAGNYFTFNTQRVEEPTSEIESYVGTVSYVWDGDPTTGEDQPVFTVVTKEVGKYTIELNTSVDIESSGATSGATIDIFIQVNDGSTFKQTAFHKDTGVIYIEKLDISFKVEDIPVKKGDNIYVFGYSSNSIDFMGWRFINFKTTAITKLEPSKSRGFFVYEAIEKLLNLITGQQNVLKSDCLGREDNGYGIDGDYSKFILNNGFLIRNFVDEDTSLPYRALTLNLKKSLASLQDIFCIGMGIEFDDDKQKVAVEPIDYFFQDKEIVRIEECSDYTEETAKEKIYNEVTVGYSKYPDEGSYMLDEFNTEQTYLTPIKSLKNKSEIKSEFIASGYAIEETRREQFDDTQSDSTTYDDNAFIIAVRKDGTTWKSEKNEDFQVAKDASGIDTIFDPSTAYNLRISPKRNLYRWAPFFNGGLVFKKSTDQIKCTSYKNNGDATSTGSDGVSITESSNVYLSAFGDRKKSFVPVWISFKCRLGIDDIILIKNAHTGRDEATKNGYVTVINDKGEYVKCYIWKMEYTPSSEQVTIKAIRKSLDVANDSNCTDYSDFTFAQFEAADLPNWIEECIFANFN